MLEQIVMKMLLSELGTLSFCKEWRTGWVGGWVGRVVRGAGLGAGGR